MAEVIGIQFEAKGLAETRSQIQGYLGDLRTVIREQQVAASKTSQAAQQQISASQKAYQASAATTRQIVRDQETEVNAVRRATDQVIGDNNRLIASLRARMADEQSISEHGKALIQERVRTLEEANRQQAKLEEAQTRAIRIQYRDRITASKQQTDSLLVELNKLRSAKREEIAAIQSTITADRAEKTAKEAKLATLKAEEKAIQSLRTQQEALAKAQQKQVQQAQSQAAKQQKEALKQQAEAAKNAKARFEEFTNVLGAFSPRAAFATRGIAGMGASLSSFAGIAAATIGIALALTAAMVGIGKAAFAMGVEGARATETIRTFANVAQTVPSLPTDLAAGAGGRPTGVRGLGIGNFQSSANEAKVATTQISQYLEQLRVDTRGTISDLELMRLTIRALQGSTQEFRDTLGPQLGEVLEATSRLARATGQNAEIVTEKFIFGLRRQENRLIDDIGIKVDAIKANERYAESIGLTVNQLTESQKRTAFATEAIRQLKIAADELGELNTTVDNLAQMNATLENMKLQVGLALEPFAAGLTQIGGEIFKAAGFLVSQLAPAIKTVSLNFKGLVQDLSNAGLNFKNLRPVLQVVANTLILVIALVNDLITVFRRLIPGIRAVVQAFIGPFAAIPKALSQTFTTTGNTASSGVEQLAYLMGYGGGAVAAAFAISFHDGLVEPVLKTVTFVANLIADFMVGFSPPKKGPLSKIDLGGYNVGKAWVDSFLDGLLTFEKRKDVLGYVNQRLGDIAKMNLEQVDARLLQLDISLRPFQERLEIVTADMERLTGFIDPALESLERIRSRSIQELKRGGGDVEALRTLDRQVYTLKKIQDLRQDQIDQARVQLAIAAARQEPERTLLEIQKRRLEMMKRDEKKDGKDGSTAGKKDGAGSGGATDKPAEPDTGAGAGVPGIPFEDVLVPGMELPSVLDDIGRGFEDAFKMVPDMQENMGEFAGAMDRLKGANPGEGLREKFTELATFFTEEFRPQVTETLNYLFGTGDDSLLGYVQTRVSNWSDQAKIDVNEFSTNLATSFKGGITDTFNSLFGAEEGSVLYTSKENIKGFITDIESSFTELLAWLVGEFDLGSTLGEVLVGPTKAAMLGVTGAVEGVIIGIIKGINDFLATEILGKPISDFTGTFDAPAPGFLSGSVAANAKGSLGFKGASIVGEKGRELIAPSSRVDIFPNRATEALVGMAQYLARHPSGHTMMLPNQTTNNSRSVVNNFSPTFNSRASSRVNMLQARQLYASITG